MKTTKTKPCFIRFTQPVSNREQAVLRVTDPFASVQEAIDYLKENKFFLKSPKQSVFSNWTCTENTVQGFIILK